MVIEVVNAVQTVIGTGAAVGAVGSASVAVKVVIETFKRLREAGVSPAESWREAKAEKRRFLEGGGEAEQRQRGKELYAEQDQQFGDGAHVRQRAKELEAEQYQQWGNVEADRVAMDRAESAMADQFPRNPNFGRMR